MSSSSCVSCLVDLEGLTADLAKTHWQILVSSKPDSIISKLCLHGNNQKKVGTEGYSQGCNAPGLDQITDLVAIMVGDSENR